MKRICWLALVLLIALPFSLVASQDSASLSLDVIGIDSTNLSQVNINASILDGSGQFVSGLGVGNFSVGGELAGLARITAVQNITDDDLAFASVLVIDTSSSMADRPIREAKQAAARYVRSLRAQDPVAIVAFSSEATLIVDYTTNRDRLLRAIDSLAYGGQTALYDATYLGIEVASRAPSPRRAVVILSDGGEYGDISAHSRDESVKAATVNGVPVYTVGLGWSGSIDRRFLELIAAETNASFYFSPGLEQLGGIYQNLVKLFRTQYIVTLDADVPADGTRYDFTLMVQTADGRSASGAATLRAPIPIPLLFLPDDLFTEALRENTQIEVEILADQDIESIEIALDGEVVSTDETYTIEPEKAEPGEHQLDITVSDVEGDVGTLSAEFEIAALPPTVSDDFDPATLAADPNAEVITIEAGGQTEITQVEFFIDDELYEVDTEAPYELNLDPFELRPGEHRLSVRASNAGGQTTTVDRVFDVDVIAPRLEVEGLAEDTVISDSVFGSVLATGQSPIMSISTDPGVAVVVQDNRMEFTLDPADFPPGRNTIALRAVDAAGAEIVQTLEFEVAALPPTVALGGLAVDAILQGARDVEVRAGGQTEITQIEVAFDDGPPQIISADTFTIPAEELGDGEHEVEVTVRNAGGESRTVRLPFTIELPPTPTSTPLPTQTATPTFTATSSPTPTHTPLPTDTPAPTVTPAPSATAAPTVTPAPSATAAPTVTPEPSATSAPSATEMPSATMPPTVTAPAPTDTHTPAPTDTHTPVPTDSDTPVPTDTHTPQPTDTHTPQPTDTHTPQPTDTPVPTDTHTPVPTDTHTPQPTNTHTPQPTDTHTPLPTDTHTPLPTDTHTPIPTDTDTPVPTDTHTPLPTDTHTPVPTDTHTPVPTDTDTPVPTDTHTPIPTDTDTPVPTETATPTPTDTHTPVPTDTDTPVPTETATPVPTDTHTPIPTDTNTPVPTETATPTPTDTDTPVPTETATPTPTDTNTPIPTDTNTPTPTDTHTPIPTDTATPTPTDTDTPVPTDTDTPVPTDTDTPTPTDTDTPVPTDTDTPVPTDTDTPTPTDTDTPVPTDTATPTPTDTHTPVPTDTATPVPTETATPTPTDTHTPVPTDTATASPTATDTPTPTDTPSPTLDITETAEAAASLTAVVQGTLDRRATEAADERATAEAAETATLTEEAQLVQPTATDAPTQEVIVEPTAQPTLTPVTITEIEAPSADDPDTRNEIIAIIAVAAGLLLLLLLFLLSRRNRG